jgi:hypothetical protein
VVTKFKKLPLLSASDALYLPHNLINEDRQMPEGRNLQQDNRLSKSTGKVDEGSPPVRRWADATNNQPRERINPNAFQTVNSPEDLFYLNRAAKLSGQEKS